MGTTSTPDQKFDPTLAKEGFKHAAVARERPIYDERVFMKVESFQLSRTGGDEWAIGSSVTNPGQKLMVRLSTAEERMVDLPKANEARLRQSYAGENRRETLAEKSQSKIQLIAFDGARPLGVTEDGVMKFRAHWPQTMAVKPDAEVAAGLGSIVMYQPREGSGHKAEAFVEFLRTATEVDGSNVRQALEAALSPRDDHNNARDTHALIRVFHEGEEIASARVFPAREKATVTDPVYGDEREVMLAIDAASSFDSLRDAKVTGLKTMDVNNDMARTIVAGLLGDEGPPKVNVLAPEQAENFFHGVKGDHLEVEVVAVERMKFGMDTAKTYLKDSDNRKFADYVVKVEVEGEAPSTERGYGNTVVAFQRYANGQPYAIYASPQENLPRASPLSDFTNDRALTLFLPPEPKAPKQAQQHDNSMEM